MKPETRGKTVAMYVLYIIRRVCDRRKNITRINSIIRHKTYNGFTTVHEYRRRGVRAFIIFQFNLSLTKNENRQLNTRAESSFFLV